MSTDPGSPGIVAGADVVRDPLTEPKRITLTGDWHGRTGWARHVIRRANRAGSGAIIQLGDFGVWPDRAGKRYLDDVASTLADYDIDLIFVDGNHEAFPELVSYPVGANGLRQLRPRLYHAPRGLRWTWVGLRFLALGGATSPDRPERTPGLDWWPEEHLTLADAHAAADGGPAEIMLTHDCPAGVEIPGLPPESIWEPEEVAAANAHRRLLRAVVDEVRPTHLYHGHFHTCYDAELDLGGGLSCAVTGLDKNESMTRGYRHLDLEQLHLDSVLRREAARSSP